MKKYLAIIITAMTALIPMACYGSTILSGVTVGKYAIVGAGSIVTKDVPDYAVAVGNPARVIKYLDKDKFNE